MIEIPEMLTLIEIAVSERGENFRYDDYQDLPEAAGLTIDAQDCAYMNPLTGQPLCIAGVVFNEAGLLELVREGDIASNQPRLVGKVSGHALGVLNAAQAAQDSGDTWGMALASAREHAQELERTWGEALEWARKRAKDLGS